MIVVINAGGTGTRLWPLSTPEYPKHLLKLTSKDSLLQEAYKRAKSISNDIYVVTEIGHVEHVKNQLPELPEEAFVVEPARRGTAGCILAGLHYVQLHHGADEPIAFLHADHVIRDVEGFAYSFKKAGEAAAEHSKITLIGIEPITPSTAFGYIQKGSQIGDGGLVYAVEGFKEKPEFDVAKEYVRSGHYLWNCGYFVGSVNTFKSALQKFSPVWFENFTLLENTADKESYKKAYLSFESDAIDYALMEHNKDLLVVPANFDWMDVGSFSDVHAVVDRDEHGNHVNCEKVAIEDVENTLIINHEREKQIGIIGLDNVVVINTKHGLLITRKDQDQKVKNIATKLKEYE